MFKEKGMYGSKAFNVAGTPIGTVRNILIAMAIAFFIAEAGYLAGYGAIRYKDPINDPWLTWIFWRYWVAAFIPIVVTVATWMLAFDFQGSRGAPTVHMGLCFITIAYMLVFIVWEVVVWTQCNDGPAPGVFDHPHCVNRDYPAKTYPDPAFFLTFFGGCLNVCIMMFYFFYTNQMRCVSTASAQVDPYSRSVMSDQYPDNGAVGMDDIDYNYNIAQSKIASSLNKSGRESLVGCALRQR